MQIQQQSASVGSLIGVFFLNKHLMRRSLAQALAGPVVEPVHRSAHIVLAEAKERVAYGFHSTRRVRFWLQVVTERKNRGVQSRCVVGVNGLKGFPEAAAVVYPKKTAQ